MTISWICNRAGVFILLLSKRTFVLPCFAVSHRTLVLIHTPVNNKMPCKPFSIIRTPRLQLMSVLITIEPSLSAHSE